MASKAIMDSVIKTKSIIGNWSAYTAEKHATNCTTGDNAIVHILL